MRKFITTLIVLPLAVAPLGGCVRTVASVATAPFKAVGQVADWATTSQDEADRNYGRKMRKKEAREGRERKAAAARCRRDQNACDGYQGYRAGYD